MRTNKGLQALIRRGGNLDTNNNSTQAFVAGLMDDDRNGKITWPEFADFVQQEALNAAESGSSNLDDAYEACLGEADLGSLFG